MTGIQLDRGLPQVSVHVTTEEIGQTSEQRASESGEVGGGMATPAKWWIASGILLVVAAAYLLASPGRIDIIDGQIRFDVAYNWVIQGQPIVRDRVAASILGVTGRDGAVYSYYGAAASVLSMPLVWLGAHAGGQDIQFTQFLFSLTSPIMGALIALVLFLFYLELGIPIRKALVWTMVSSFATYIWPISCTSFDNPQHALFALAAAFLGYLSSKRKSNSLAAAGGWMAGILILYQEYFLLIVPALALSTLNWSAVREEWVDNGIEVGRKSGWARVTSTVCKPIRNLAALLRAALRGPGEARSSCLRYAYFLVGVTAGLLLSFAYNDLRFGSFLDNGKMHALSQRHPVWGNPIVGLPTLLVSPGKSLFLYSPPLVLGLLGIRFLWRRNPEVAFAVVNASILLVSFMSCYAGLGGDFCWGPRYLTVLLPLWSLAFPFVPLEKVRRDVVLGIVALGLVIQTMAVSVEPQRFFFERGFEDLFWAEDPWVYFKHSALFARVPEVASLSQGPPATAQFTTPTPNPDWYTYSILGPPLNVPRSESPLWMQNFKIFYLPRPFPLAMSWIRPALRPINLGAWLWGILATGLLGVGLIYRGFGLTRRKTERAKAALCHSC